ncbi:MAG: hypothetical protein ABSD88_12030 [Candidatus Korobacteraceae bacterium]|jgi:hypothetical protein
MLAIDPPMPETAFANAGKQRLRKTIAPYLLCLRLAGAFEHTAARLTLQQTDHNKTRQRFLGGSLSGQADAAPHF